MIDLGPSNLTVEALQQHNTSTSDDRALDSISDAGSIGGHSANTFKTWASNWTDCTNATFSKVHSRFNANSTEYQREVSSFSLNPTVPIHTKPACVIFSFCVTDSRSFGCSYGSHKD